MVFVLLFIAKNSRFIQFKIMTQEHNKERRFWEMRNKVYSIFLENFIPYNDLLEIIVQELNPAPNLYILDAGCGPGILEKMITRKKIPDMKVEALDISRKIIDVAKKTNNYSKNVVFKIANLNNKLEYNDCSFDAIVCINVLYLIQRPTDILSEFYRILRNGGKLIISTPKYNFSYISLLLNHFSKGDTIRKIKSLIFLPLIFFFEFVITKHEREGKYHQLNQNDTIKLFQGTNFRDLKISSCYADQNFLVIAKK